MPDAVAIAVSDGCLVRKVRAGDALLRRHRAFGGNELAYVACRLCRACSKVVGSTALVLPSGARFARSLGSATV